MSCKTWKYMIECCWYIEGGRAMRMSEISIKTERVIDLARKHKRLTQLKKEGRYITDFDPISYVRREKRANPQEALDEMRRIVTALDEKDRLKMFQLLQKKANTAREIEKKEDNPCEASAVREACDTASGFVYALLSQDNVSSK